MVDIPHRQPGFKPSNKLLAAGGALLCIFITVAAGIAERQIESQKGGLRDVAVMAAFTVDQTAKSDHQNVWTGLPSDNVLKTVAELAEKVRAAVGFIGDAHFLLIQDAITHFHVFEQFGNHRSHDINNPPSSASRARIPTLLRKDGSIRSEVFRRVLAGEVGVTTAESLEGEEAYMAYAPIPTIGMGLVVELPIDDAWLPILGVIAACFAFFVAVYLAIATIMVRSSRTFARTLSENAERVSDFARLSAEWFWESDRDHRFTVLEGANESLSQDLVNLALGKTRMETTSEATTTQKWDRHRELLAGRMAFRDFVYAIRPSEGDERIVSVSGVPIFDEAGVFAGYRGVGRDITADTQSQAQIRRTSDRLRTTFNAITTGIVLIDRQGVIDSINPAAERIFGYSETELVGKNVSMLMPEPDRSRHDDYIQNYLRTGRGNIIGVGRDVSAVRKDGGEIEIHLGISELDIEGRFLLVGSITDISQSKLMEQQLRRTQKMEAIGQLSGGIAHDFNNLLGIVIGNLDLALRKIEPHSGLRKHIEKAIKAAKRGGDLTGRLSRFARKTVETKVERIDASRAVAEIVDLVKKSLTPNVEVHVDLSTHEQPISVNHGDLEDALINLAVNARDAMPDGGTLSFGVARKVFGESPVGVAPRIKAGAYVQISVSDTGSGMPPEVATRIFEPFFTTKDAGKGTGLGLSMVYGFVSRASGGIAVYSEAGTGSTFRIFLPLAEEPASLLGAASRADADILPGGDETILVVDDEPDLAEIAENYLKEKGYEVIVRADGVSALEFLAENPRVRLLFSDLIMPGGLSGYDLAVLAQRERPALRVLLTSGYDGGKGDGAQANTGDPPMLRKPYSRDELLSRVRKTLDEPPFDSQSA